MLSAAAVYDNYNGMYYIYSRVGPVILGSAKSAMLWIYRYVITNDDESRRAVVSLEAKKKQHTYASSGLHDHYSELFTWMAAQNF